MSYFLQKPQWVDWGKWRRRSWLGIAIAVFITGIILLYRYSWPVLRDNWPW